MHENKKDFAPGMIFIAPKMVMENLAVHKFIHGILIYESLGAKFLFHARKYHFHS